MKYSVLSVLFLVGCGFSEFDSEFKRIGEKEIIVPYNPSYEEEIVEIVDYYNEFRVEGGQLPFTRGLTCTLHNAANGDLDVSFGPTAYAFTMMGTFNQPEINAGATNNMIPDALKALYTNVNYSLRCQGQIVIVESGYHSFSLNSDDGSRLYIGNSLVIDNEGNHTMTIKNGARLLQRGMYTFRVDYSQSGGGKQGLVLKMNNEVINGNLFYR